MCPSGQPMGPAASSEVKGTRARSLRRAAQGDPEGLRSPGRGKTREERPTVVSPRQDTFAPEAATKPIEPVPRELVWAARIERIAVVANERLMVAPRPGRDHRRGREALPDLRPCKARCSDERPQEAGEEDSAPSGAHHQPVSRRGGRARGRWPCNRIMMSPGSISRVDVVSLAR